MGVIVAFFKERMKMFKTSYEDDFFYIEISASFF